MQHALAAQPEEIHALDLRGIDWEAPAFWEEMRPMNEDAGAAARSAAAEFDAGVVERRGGHREDGLEHFRRAEAAGFYLDYDDGGDPSYEIGLLLLQAGQVHDARTALSLSLSRHPGILRTLVAVEVA